MAIHENYIGLKPGRRGLTIGSKPHTCITCIFHTLKQNITSGFDVKDEFNIVTEYIKIAYVHIKSQRSTSPNHLQIRTDIFEFRNLTQNI